MGEEKEGFDDGADDDIGNFAKVNEQKFGEMRRAAGPAKARLREELILLNSGLVHFLGRRLAGRFRVAWDVDVEQQMFLKLIEAVDKYDPGHETGARFSTFVATFFRYAALQIVREREDDWRLSSLSTPAVEDEERPALPLMALAAPETEEQRTLPYRLHRDAIIGAIMSSPAVSEGERLALHDMFHARLPARDAARTRLVRRAFFKYTGAEDAPVVAPAAPPRTPALLPPTQPPGSANNVLLRRRWWRLRASQDARLS